MEKRREWIILNTSKNMVQTKDQNQGLANFESDEKCLLIKLNNFTVDINLLIKLIFAII
jgi:hypothetical protein